VTVDDALRITAVETRTYRIALNPPFRAAWDPEPRTAFDATLVVVSTDAGITGYASGGDGLPDRAALERLLRGVDPRRGEHVREVCETIDFHGGRPWAVEVACWDIAGKAAGEPLWRLLGGRADRIGAYASGGELATPDERAARARVLADAGVRATKIRFHHEDWRDDVAVIARVREAVGDRLEIMVDANQGWRMPGDRAPRWDVATAARVANELDELGVYWLEEPLRTDDYDGYAALRRRTDVRIAAGEMVRSMAEARDLLLRGEIDVLQTDVLLTGGVSGNRRIAALADLHGRVWSPHTWSNGYGLVANLHVACAFSTCPFLEVPYDPPAWSPARRDFLLRTELAIAPDGSIAPPAGPGLGVEPDLDALEEHRVA
jgi:L-alanine-DL-glutamate epimerase-like enolase superfamily enzyme